MEIAIGLAQILFTLLEQQGLNEEQVIAFILEQRIKFRTENAPGNLPKPPVLGEE